MSEQNDQKRAAGIRLLPNLTKLQATLTSVPVETLLARTREWGTALPEATSGEEGVFESFNGSGENATDAEIPAPAFEAELPEGGSDLPQPGAVDLALETERAATLRAGARAVGKLVQHGNDAELTPPEETGLEAIILLFGRPAILIQDGKFFPVPSDWSMLEEYRPQIEATFQSVGRIEVTGHPRLEWVGTGFLVAPDVLMTNRHVAVEFTTSQADGTGVITPGISARVDFREELGTIQGAEYAIANLIGIHPHFDMALFRVASTGGTDGTTPIPRPLPLFPAPPDPILLAGRSVYVVGYPAWDGRRNDPQPMQRLFGNVYNVKRLQPGTVMRYMVGEGILLHDCSTLGGNSGSCVIDLETHQLLGLHFGGLYQQSNRAVALWELRDDPLFQKAGITIG